MNPDRTITIQISAHKADAISLGLSDLLCWLDGFCAARTGTDLDRFSGPMGVNDVREINLMLKKALNDADAKHKDTDQ